MYSRHSLLALSLVFSVAVHGALFYVAPRIHLTSLREAPKRPVHQFQVKLRPPTAEETAQGWTFPPGYCHFPSGDGYGDEHFKQLCAEQLVNVVNRRTKRAKAEWQQVIDTNLTGVFHGCHAAIPELRRRGGGWIINISSLAGKNAFPGAAAYCASKAGLNAFSEALMQEVRYDGIFAFKYSKRPDTAALKLSGHLPEGVKEARLARVLDAQKEITIQKNREHIGTVKEILIDGRSKRGGMLTGRTRGNRVVNVAGPASLMGSVVTVRITSAGVNSLTGEICA